MKKTYYEIDETTGELKPTEDRLVVLNEGDQVRRKSQIEYARASYNAKNTNGHFVWLLFKYGENLFPNLSSANLARLMYAATFCNEDGAIMSKSDLRTQMNLTKPRWSEFWTETADNNILYEKDNMVYVNTKMFCKGNIQTDNNYIRLFCEYIQVLYEQCTSSDMHKQLAYIFKIIPFVNRRTNIVCFNPIEQDEQKIKHMRLGDFCDVLGYGRKNARRLAKDLLKIRINGELAVGFFVGDMNEEKWIMVINPRIYFGGKYDMLFQKYRGLFIQEAKEYKELLVLDNSSKEDQRGNK